MSKRKHAYSRQTEQALHLFGEQIRYARKIHNMTVAELSERLGVSRTTVQSVEKGSPLVAIGTYFEATTLLGIPVFQSDVVSLDIQEAFLRGKTAILPAYIRKKTTEVKDDF